MTRRLPASTPPPVRAALAEAKARLEALYGDRLERLVLYGSHARGDAREDSDVDLLVVLRGEVHGLTELRRLGPLILDLAMAHGELVSFHPRAATDAEAERTPFLRHVRAEGVPV